MSSSNRKERFIFAGLCFVSALVVLVYVYSAMARVASPVQSSALSSRLPATPASTPTPEAPRASALPASIPIAKPDVKEPTVPVVARRIFFRHNALDNDYGKLAFVSEDQLEKIDHAGRLSCETVYVAAGQGICLTANRGVLTTYEAQLFDAKTFEVAKKVSLAGIPSRCRVSPDGKMIAFTVFVTGHSYSSGDFSTQTHLLDAHTGEVLADLENFEITRDGQPFKNTDFNFWGVTFTRGGKNFYCTLSSNKQHYLIKGEVASRTGKVIHEQVECPSLSPDGTRIAYKKRYIIDNRLIWRLQILDLQSGKETTLRESRSVDDQLEWFNNHDVLYSLPANESGPSASTNVWITSADGNSVPKLFLKNGYSPSVER
jgi:hypothetical protein